jgi:hypothetical protein
MVLESFTKLGTTRQHLLGLVKDSRITDLWLELLGTLYQYGKLKTSMKIFKLFIGMAEYYTISMEGAKQVGLGQKQHFYNFSFHDYTFSKHIIL